MRILNYQPALLLYMISYFQNHASLNNNPNLKNGHALQRPHR